MTLLRHGISGLLFLVLAAVCVHGAEPKRLLLIHSFGREFAPFDAVAANFRTELIRQSTDPVDIHEASLESARFSETPQEGPFVGYLMAMFGKLQLDLVVTIGGPAARFAQKHRQDLFHGTPMLIAGVDELHLQPTLWESYRRRIVAASSMLLGEALLIVLLFANLMKRRRAERSLRESEERLSLAADAADVGVWEWDFSRNQVWATANWRKMFGFPLDAAIQYETMVERIHPNDRASVESAVQRALKEGTEYVSEHRVTLPDGKQRWISARGRRYCDEANERARILGASVDITERREAEESARNLTGRLIGAQEVERARLARELHDDITQRLARLAIDVGRCEQGTAPESPTVIARTIRESLVSLCEDVHSLSYRLHPAVLEDLGLRAALTAECERFAAHASAHIELRLLDIPETVPRDAALCLFRVAQEALRNALRHSQARNVDLSVRVLDGGLQLAVRDDGCGFDPGAQRNRPSLGLASMGERVHLVGGDLDIESTPGHGATIVMWVPLKGGAS